MLYHPPISAFILDDKIEDNSFVWYRAYLDEEQTHYWSIYKMCVPSVKFKYEINLKIDFEFEFEVKHALLVS